MTNHNSTGIADLSQNKYANVLREISNGLTSWAGLLLIPFILYFTYQNEEASIFSFMTLLIIVGAEIVFQITVFLSNAILSLIMSLLFAPFIMKNIIKPIQNIQNTVLLIFAIIVLIGSWFFSEMAVNYAYFGSLFIN